MDPAALFFLFSLENVLQKKDKITTDQSAPTKEKTRTVVGVFCLSFNKERS